MGFILHRVDGSARPQSFERLPFDDIQPKYGLALKWTSGQLTKCGATDKPDYICMEERGAAVAENTPIAVLKVHPDMVFAVPTQADNSGTSPGTLIQIHTDGLQVTATTSSSPKVMFIGFEKDGKAGDTVYVRIP